MNKKITKPKAAATAHIRLTLDVRYDLDGESAERLRQVLHTLPDLAADNGLMTPDDSPATVSEWHAKTEIVTKEA